MKKMKIAMLTTLLAASPLALADLSYTNFGVGYVDGDYGNADIDGLELRGSFAINSSIHLQASYDALDISPGNGDFDVLAFGGGWHTLLAEELDFVATASILDVDAGIFDGDGIRLTGGLRGKISRELEFGAHLIYEDINDIPNVGDDTGYELEGRYFFNRNNSVGLTLRDVNKVDTFRIDVRFDF